MALQVRPGAAPATLLNSVKSEVQAHVAAAVEAVEGASAKELSRVVAVKDAEHAVATAAAVVRTWFGLGLANPNPNPNPKPPQRRRCAPEPEP